MLKAHSYPQSAGPRNRYTLQAAPSGVNPPLSQDFHLFSTDSRPINLAVPPSFGETSRQGIYSGRKEPFLSAQQNIIFRLPEHCAARIGWCQSGSSRHGRLSFIKDRLEVLAKTLKPFEERCPRIQPRSRSEFLYSLSDAGRASEDPR
jgi:hypothetical protein